MLTLSPNPKHLTIGLGLVRLVAFECTSCADGLVFPHSKVENALISNIGGALGIILSTDAVAPKLNVSFVKFGNLHMEATFLESPPLGLKIPILMDKVGFGASSKIGNPCQDNAHTSLYSIGS